MKKVSVIKGSEGINFVVAQAKPKNNKERRFKVFLDLKGFSKLSPQIYTESQIINSLINKQRWYTGLIGEDNQINPGEELRAYLSTKGNRSTGDNLNNLPLIDE